MSMTSQIIDVLLDADRHHGVADIVRASSVRRHVVSATLARLATYGRISTAVRSAGRRDYWMTEPQQRRERLRRAMFSDAALADMEQAARAAAPVSSVTQRLADVGVAILTDPVRLAGRLIYLERLLARPVFAGDATLTAIAADYRATLAAVQAREEAEESA